MVKSHDKLTISYRNSDAIKLSKPKAKSPTCLYQSIKELLFKNICLFLSPIHNIVFIFLYDWLTPPWPPLPIYVPLGHGMVGWKGLLTAQKVYCCRVINTYEGKLYNPKVLVFQKNKFKKVKIQITTQVVNCHFSYLSLIFNILVF